MVDLILHDKKLNKGLPYKGDPFLSFHWKKRKRQINDYNDVEKGFTARPKKRKN